MNDIERRRDHEGQNGPMESIRRVLRGRIEPIMSEEFGDGFRILGRGFLLEMFPRAHVVVANGGVQSTTLKEVTYVSARRGEVVFAAGSEYSQRTLIIDRDGKIEILPGKNSSREGIIEGEPVLRVHEGEGAKPEIVVAAFTIRTIKGNTQSVRAIGRESKLGRLRNGDFVRLRGRMIRVREPSGEETDAFFARTIALRFAF